MISNQLENQYTPKWLRLTNFLLQISRVFKILSSAPEARQIHLAPSISLFCASPCRKRAEEPRTYIKDCIILSDSQGQVAGAWIPKFQIMVKFSFHFLVWFIWGRRLFMLEKSMTLQVPRRSKVHFKCTNEPLLS